MSGGLSEQSPTRDYIRSVLRKARAGKVSSLVTIKRASKDTDRAIEAARRRCQAIQGVDLWLYLKETDTPLPDVRGLLRKRSTEARLLRVYQRTCRELASIIAWLSRSDAAMPPLDVIQEYTRTPYILGWLSSSPYVGSPDDSSIFHQRFTLLQATINEWERQEEDE